METGEFSDRVTESTGSHPILRGRVSVRCINQDQLYDRDGTRFQVLHRWAGCIRLL